MAQPCAFEMKASPTFLQGVGVKSQFPEFGRQLSGFRLLLPSSSRKPALLPADHLLSNRRGHQSVTATDTRPLPLRTQDLQCVFFSPASIATGSAFCGGGNGQVANSV